MTINDLNSQDKIIERNNNLTNNLVIIDFFIVSKDAM